MIDEIPSSTKEWWEGDMPWTGKQFKKKNKGLSDPESEDAAAQASAIVEKGGDEGMAIATANKRMKSLRQAHGARKGKTRKAMRNMRRSGPNSEMRHSGAEDG